MKKYNIIISIFFLLFLTYTLLNIDETKISTLNILQTFSKTILPSLLPFLIINQIIISLGIIDFLSYFLQYISIPLFKISGKGASIIIIGILNGFPSSVIFTSLMLINNQIEKKEAQRLINAIFFPSISFLFSVLSPNLNNNKLFTLLIISIYLGGFILLYISSLKDTIPQIITFKETITNTKNKLNNFSLPIKLKEVIHYSFNTLLNILGIIVIFSIPCNIISKTVTNNASYLLKGLIEFSMPSISISLLSINKKTIVLLLSTILSFSSLSSIMQATIFINEASLNCKQFIINRIFMALLSTFLLYLII